MSGIGNQVKTSLTTLLGRDVPDSVSNWLDTSTSFSTITSDSDAATLSDAELYEIAQKLLEEADLDAATPEQIAEYEEIAQAIFAIISADDSVEIEDDDVSTTASEATPDYAGDVQEFVDIKQTIQDDIEDDGEIDTNNVEAYLDSLDPANIPSIIAALGEQEQAAIIAYYYEQNTDDANNIVKNIIQEIPQTSLDDVIEEMYENGNKDDVKQFLQDRFTGQSEADIQTDLAALLSTEGRFDNLDADYRADFVSELVAIFQSDTLNVDYVSSGIPLDIIATTADTTPPVNLGLSLIKELQQHSDFVNDVNASTDDGLVELRALLDPNPLSTFNPEEQFLALLPSTLKNDLDNVLTDSQSDGEIAAEGLISDIISGRESTGFNIATPVTKQLDAFVTGTPAALNKADFKDFLDEILSNNSSLTNEEYVAVLEAVKAFVGTDTGSIREGIFNDALEDVEPQSLTRLSTSFNITGTVSIALDTESAFSVSDTQLQAVKDIFDKDSYSLTDFDAIDIDTLLLASQDNKLSNSEQSFLLGVVTQKALSTPEGLPGGLEALHQSLQFFPKVLDNFEEMLENNPANQVLNFLTSPLSDDTNYKAIRLELLADQEIFQEVLLDGFDGDIDETYDKTTDLNGAHEKLFDEWSDPPNDAAEYAAFTNYIGNSSGNPLADKFKNLTSLDSALYQALDGDKEEFFDDMVNWLLSENSASQKAFLESIPPYSELHLALIAIADDILSDDSESDLGEALQSITDNIADGSDISTNDIKTLFDEDEDNLSDYVSDIFNIIEDYEEEGTISKEIQDFISILGNDGLTEDEAQTFLAGLSIFESQRFFQSLLSDNSVLFATDQDLSKIMDTLLTIISSDDISNTQRRQFLETIPEDGMLFTFMENAGLDADILEAIKDQDLTDFDDSDIQEFFNDELKLATQIWVNSDLIRAYIDEIDALNDIDSLDVYDSDSRKYFDNIFDDAVDKGHEQILFSQLLLKNDTPPSDSLIFSVFSWLDDNKLNAETFFEKLPANSAFSKALMVLIDKGAEPFDDIDYKINEKTGQLEFDSSDLNKLINLLSDADSEATILFSNEINKQQNDIDDLDDAEGADDRAFRRLTSEAQEGGKIDFSKYLGADEDDSDDFSNAEDILDLLLEDNNYLFQSLNDAQLKNFMTQFLDYMKNTDDNLIEYFGDAFASETDSFFTEAMIESGVDAEGLEEANSVREYKNILKDASDIDAFVQTIRISQKSESFNGTIQNYMSETMRGLKDKQDIEKAADDILDLAFYNEDDLEDLIQDALSNNGKFKTLTPKQSEILMEKLFERIKEQDAEDGENYSNAMILFIDSLEGSDFYESHVKDQNKYKDIVDYYENDNDNGFKSALDNLLGDTGTIEDYSKDNTSQNDQVIEVANDSVVGNDDAEENYKDSTIIDGYNALYKLYDRIDLRGETGQLSENFLRKSGQSGEDIGELAADNAFSYDDIVGLIALLPPKEAAAFIEAYLSNGGGNDNDEVGFLLGQLMIRQIDGDIDNDDFEDIIDKIDDSNNSAVEDYFGKYNITSLIDNAELRQAAMLSWKLVADDKAEYSSSYISDTILHAAQWIDPGYGGGSGANPIWPPATGGAPGFPSPWFPPIQPFPSAEDYYMRGYVDGLTQSIVSGGPLVT
ncbi:MAG: hypothetical protein ACJARD_000406 [Alphaproteobacteria bacterium]|jgi:hypothetical protein